MFNIVYSSQSGEHYKKVNIRTVLQCRTSVLYNRTKVKVTIKYSKIASSPYKPC